MNRIGNNKARKYKFIYNRPRAVLRKAGKKRKVMVVLMEGQTTKQSPSPSSQ